MRERLESKYFAMVVVLDNVSEGKETAALERLHFIVNQLREESAVTRYQELRQLARELNVLLYYRAQQYKVNFLESHAMYQKLEQRAEDCESPEALTAFLEQTVREYCGLIRRDSRRHYSNLIRSCLDHIDQNFTNTITVETEAVRLNVSRSYLSHRFAQETGSRLTDYVNGLRIRHACTLLENLQFPIQRVAEAAGFSTSNYFARLFRARMGMTPREYREVRQKKQR